MAKKTVEDMRSDFNNKSILLSKLYTQLSPYEFVDEVWKNPDKLMLIFEEDMYREMEYDEAFDIWVHRDDVYVSPCSFFQGCYLTKTVNEVFAFVIDVDNITAAGLEQVIKNQLDNTIPLPSYIVNSGGGVHLYYVFNKPIPYFHANRLLLKQMYNRLWYVCDMNISCRVDKTGIIQPFRPPGSRTKLGQTAAAYQVSGDWNPISLMKRLGIEPDEETGELPKISYWDPMGYKRDKKKKVKQRAATGGNASPKFYDYCYERILKKTREGHRYLSMYALAVVAYKTRTPKERLESDLQFLWEKFNATGSEMKRKELDKALKGYSPVREKVTSQTLEEWFGWEFPRNSVVRKGNDQKTHLAIARFTRDLKMLQQGRKWTDGNGRPKGAKDKDPRKTKQQQVQEWRLANPEGKKADCIRETGISKPTVYKWWDV